MDDGDSEGDGEDSGEGSCGVGGGADEGSDVSKSCSLVQVFLKSYSICLLGFCTVLEGLKKCSDCA